jgi:YHS domain-containing protein
MMRFLFLEVLLPLLLFWLVRNILRTILGGMKSSSLRKSSRPSPTVHTVGELKKDPVCGTFVSVDASVTKRVNGELVHFCSPGCRDNYRSPKL